MAAFISYNSSNKTYTVAPGASTIDINSAIRSAPDGSTIFFAAGNHVLTQQVSVWRDHITLKGAGAGLTTLTISQTGASVSDGIRISGSKDATWSGGLSADVARGDRVITLGSTAGLKAGDILHVQQSNDADFMADGTYSNIAKSSYLATNSLRESLVEIDHIVGNTVYLKHEIAYDMEGGRASVARYGYLEDISVSDFTVTYNLPDADDALFENTVAAFDNKAALSVERTQNVEIKNIEFLNVASHALEVRRSIEASVDSIKTDGALNKGGDGNGYSVHIAETFYSTFTNLELMNGRHAVVFSSWSAEAYNNIHVALTNRDINYHGSPDHSNVVVVDRMVYEGGTDYTGAARSWYAVGPGSDMHPASTIDDNITVFKYLEAAAKNDVVYGWDGGAYLDTKSGNDVIIGGAGGDTIIGGTGNDAMAGGAGADIFHFAVGDGNDVISDFQGGAGGDTIILKNMLQFPSASAVTLVQVGSDALLQLAGNNSILFQNFNAADFRAENVVVQNSITVLNATNTMGIDAFRGSTLDDTVNITAAGFSKDDWIDLAQGTYDRIVVKGEGFYFNAGGMARLAGVEVIDLRGVTGGAMTLKLSDAIVASADSARLKVAIGAVHATLDTYGVLDTREVHLYGAGHATLASNGPQRATLESKNGTLNVLGGTGSDILKIKGSSGVVLNAGAGHDTVTISSNAAHTVHGGDGNDKFIYTFSPTAGMVLNGGAGTDTIHFTGSVNAGISATSGWSGIENISFNGANNTIALHNTLASGALNIEGVGGVRNVTLDVSALTLAQVIQMDENINLTLSGAASGALTVKLISGATGVFQGGAGAETVVGYSKADKLYGGGGNDVIDGGAGNDLIYGQDGNDMIYGGSGVDTIYGGAGDDVLNGGTSGDHLWGGVGDDRFIIDVNSTRDIIYDFNTLAGEGDVLDLTALFDANGLGAKTFTTAISGGFLKLTQSGNDVNVGFDVDGSAGSAYTLKTIATMMNETVGDLNATTVLV